MRHLLLHPGLHINPHLDVTVIIGAVVGLVALAVIIGLVHVHRTLRQERTDRQIRERLTR